MTKSEFLAIVNAYGEDNLLCITFDNEHKEFYMSKDHKFKTSSIKTIGGIDVIEMDHEKLPNKETGKLDIPCVIVHPLDTVQCISFCSGKDKQNIDRSRFYNKC